MFCLVDKTEFKSVFTKQKPGAFFKWQLLISWCANLVARKLLKATFQLWKLARKNVAYVLVYIPLNAEAAEIFLAEYEVLRFENPLETQICKPFCGEKETECVTALAVKKETIKKIDALEHDLDEADSAR